MKEQSFVYILTNQRHTVFYTGVTSNLLKRIWEHKNKVVKGFTQMYSLDRLVWYEIHESIEDAILREKQIKGGSRRKKIKLIEKMNYEWKDLYNSLI